MATFDDFLRDCDTLMRSAMKEIEKDKKSENNVEKAKELFSIYSSFITAGFKEEQAWELLITFIKNI
jgi:hypothetical protein